MEMFRLNPVQLAAIVYDDGVAVDSLMTVFARELSDDGSQIAGLVQLPPETAGCGPDAPMRLQDIGTGEVIPICQTLGPGASSCKLDSQALAGAAVRLRLAAERPSHLLVVSKFGRQEAAGQGFRAELAFALTEGRTVLTAVKRGLVDNWLSFTGGYGTLLEPRLWVLHDWWRDVHATTIH